MPVINNHCQTKTSSCFTIVISTATFSPGTTVVLLLQTPVLLTQAIVMMS